MPVEDPSSGRLVVWLISCVLFTSIATGGSFLITYLVTPPSADNAWLPIAGVALVCLPWIFWLLTCCYRIFSRTCGFRFAIGGGGGGEGGGGGGGATPNELSDLESGGGGVGVQSDVNGGNERKTNEGNENSVTSRESEMPLKLSMAS
ncbi:hypothetical protein Tsubulata_037045 [Turnera subulata]|uniref:Uncharacterized protein n=1 Tax=Turnera subulata TaxID=218843 RepID=A0A9Q0FHF1_9ROSI|nr:hypothetical protein Tsubulata_037045 [Turnera subulata]